jgi:2-hydroxychromene-2-carboxylate isomerase
MADIERRARGRGMPPVRWPDPWPTSYLFAMRATTYAFSAGLGREFAEAAYRSAFQRGGDLSIPAHVLAAGREVGIADEQLEAGVADADVKAALREATDRAFELGVIGVPTVAIDDELFWGDDRLEDAAAYLRAVTAA